MQFRPWPRVKHIQTFYKPVTNLLQSLYKPFCKPSYKPFYKVSYNPSKNFLTNLLTNLLANCLTNLLTNFLTNLFTNLPTNLLTNLLTKAHHQTRQIFTKYGEIRQNFNIIGQRTSMYTSFTATRTTTTKSVLRPRHTTSLAVKNHEFKGRTPI